MRAFSKPIQCGGLGTSATKNVVDVGSKDTCEACLDTRLTPLKLRWCEGSTLFELPPSVCICFDVFCCCTGLAGKDIATCVQEGNVGDKDNLNRLCGSQPRRGTLYEE